MLALISVKPTAAALAPQATSLSSKEQHSRQHRDQASETQAAPSNGIGDGNMSKHCTGASAVPHFRLHIVYGAAQRRTDSTPNALICAPNTIRVHCLSDMCLQSLEPTFWDAATSFSTSAALLELAVATAASSAVAG